MDILLQKIRKSLKKNILCIVIIKYTSHKKGLMHKLPNKHPIEKVQKG